MVVWLIFLVRQIEVKIEQRVQCRSSANKLYWEKWSLLVWWKEWKSVFVFGFSFLWARIFTVLQWKHCSFLFHVGGLVSERAYPCPSWWWSFGCWAMTIIKRSNPMVSEAKIFIFNQAFEELVATMDQSVASDSVIGLLPSWYQWSRSPCLK